MPSTSTSPHLRARRRTTVLAAPLAGLAGIAAGCRWGPEGPEESTTNNSPTGDRSADPDLVAQARAAVTEAATLVEATGRAHIGLSTPLASVADLHAAHLEVLADPSSPAEKPPAPAVPEKSGKALTLIVSTERTLQLTLTTLAAEVASGDLARALASMGAGVAQAVTVLAEVKAGGKP